MSEWLLMAFLALTGTATLSGSIKIIKQGEEALVETLGRYDGKKLEPGLNFITPFLSQVAFQDTIREKVLEIPPQNCITRDNVSITVDAVVYWRIMNMERAYYKVQNLHAAMVNLVLTQIRSELGKLELNQTFTARAEVNEMLLRELDIATSPWGVKVTRVELRDIVPSKTVQGAMELQMSAERKKQAAILTSEGEREAVINSARGEAEAQIIEAEARQKAAILEAEAQQKQQILKAQGTAAAMEIIAKKLNNDPSSAKALQFLMAQNYLDMGMKIGSSNSSKVMFLDPRTIPSTLEGIGSIVGEVNEGELTRLS
ncbi:MAG TPA: paraslipin [Cyanobacteria bacterium UBA11149]|nr:paraslipin [Cyanobacteria bacterium UBA11367]HBE57627.1 paraslipin [Cyanobacteria bacterium UBA11366]HBK62152.1 paraslipin [Cyanobacteria bacterium UBA11166]HBR73170.1 paraslipin [Cyanobacteria bacterium UBA11159]HBS69556.1 paraslipin [Cyanobacteria bacterium UBA11153]HBW88048.1 paraslipin [Cyanobacteria bacterium UBA11149]HCA93231.1 paraslipin [Cyanobacteria bacterium UBA9226]